MMKNSEDDKDNDNYNDEEPQAASEDGMEVVQEGDSSSSRFFDLEMVEMGMIKDRLTIAVTFMTCIPDPLLLFVDVDDVLVGGVRLRERVKLVHLLDVPDK